MENKGGNETKTCGQGRGEEGNKQSYGVEPQIEIRPDDIIHFILTMAKFDLSDSGQEALNTRQIHMYTETAENWISYHKK